MCVGLPILGIALSAMSGLAGFAADSAAATAQDNRYKANLENTKTATFDKFDSINNRVTQENSAATQDMTNASIDGLKARSQARTAASAGGVAGNSVDAIIGDMRAREGRYLSDTKTNFDFQKQYWNGEGKSTAAQGQGQVNSVPRGTPPSIFPMAINLFGSVIKAFPGAAEA